MGFRQYVPDSPLNQSRAALPISHYQVAQDRQEVRCSLPAARLTTLDRSERDALSSYLAHLADQLNESPTAKATSPPQSNGRCDRGFNAIVGTNRQIEARSIAGVPPKPAIPLTYS